MTNRTPTSTKLLGDVSAEDRNLAEQLELAERQAEKEPLLPADRRAQMYVCLAHDWYQLDMEEEGNRLLLKAERVSPGYFKETVIKHTQEDPNFDLLVKNITLRLLHMLVGNLSDRV